LGVIEYRTIKSYPALN